jgi:hypothetical protein
MNSYYTLTCQKLILRKQEVLNLSNRRFKKKTDMAQIMSVWKGLNFRETERGECIPNALKF